MAVAVNAPKLRMDSTPFPNFAQLLEACAAFASLSGARYTQAMFQNIQGDDSDGDRARIDAMPVVASYASRISDGFLDLLLPDFRVAERWVVREGVFRSMVATCRSLDLWPARARLQKDDTTYQDVSEPLEHIAQRLYNFSHCRAEAGEEATNNERSLAATFVTEFGREHGLRPGPGDQPSENMLFGFLERVKEWGERRRISEVQPQLELLPADLREKAEDWWKKNWKTVAIGTGVLVAGAAVAGMLFAAAASSNNRQKEKRSDEAR